MVNFYLSSFYLFSLTLISGSLQGQIRIIINIISAADVQDRVLDHMQRLLHYKV